MRLRFDRRSALKLFATLTDLWTRKASVFEGVTLPQDRVVTPDDTVDKANWFFFAAITQRGGIVSEDPFKYLQVLHREYSELFDPKAIVRNWTRQQIQEALTKVVIERRWKNGNPPAPAWEQIPLKILRELPNEITKDVKKGLYKVDEFANSWRRNAISLVERWDCNVLNAYAGVRDFEEVFARIDYKRNEFGFHGMRRKIFSLLTIWLQEKGLVPVFPTPVPVDFHAMRLLFATGVVVAEDAEPFVVHPETHPPRFACRPYVRVTEELMDEIAIWSQKFIYGHGFSHMVINPALWVFSRELCPNELQNQSEGRRERMKLNYPEDLERHPLLWPTPYRDPAKICPLAKLCRKAVPWAPYYDFGLLALERRLEYPHPALSLDIKPNGQMGRNKDKRQ